MTSTDWSKHVQGLHEGLSVKYLTPSFILYLHVIYIYKQNGQTPPLDGSSCWFVDEFAQLFDGLPAVQNLKIQPSYCKQYQEEEGMQIQSSCLLRSFIKTISFTALDISQSCVVNWWNKKWLIEWIESFN